MVEALVKKSVENGIDVIRIFDALNDTRNLQTSIRAAKEAGGEVQAAICYTTHEGFARRTGAACAAYDVPDRGILACGASAGKDRL